ncbi:hypothetical protein BD310DRAFT_493535 [Dichomitus squalens]|nr:hypothetical protein BD310DRAFT_493535 [Dichomitus squalens]
MEIDAQLCQLLGTLSLTGQARKATYASEEQPQRSQIGFAGDAVISDYSNSEDSTCQPSLSRFANVSAPLPPPPNCGCAYLQAVHEQIRSGKYGTTSGDYLETIFTHRDALFAFPQGHRSCAAGFTELARDLEQRDSRGQDQSVNGGWRPDWDGDHEAVVAFRHEAWVIANSL